MAYFSNGTEGAVLDAQCAQCPLGQLPCPTMGVQLMYNYDQCSDRQELLREAMNQLVDENGICQTFELLKKVNLAPIEEAKDHAEAGERAIALIKRKSEKLTTSDDFGQVVSGLAALLIVDGAKGVQHHIIRISPSKVLFRPHRFPRLTYEQRRVPAFVSQASELAQRGHVDHALDLIYDGVDSMMSHGNNEELNLAFANVDPTTYHEDLVFGLLTASLPVKGKLPNRKDFYSRFSAHLIKKEGSDLVLAGLE